jgi:transcriptional regulator with XRE-family HTH domain
MTLLEAYLSRTGRTERALADAAGVSFPYLNQIKSGRRRPSPEFAKRIEAATNGEVPAGALLGLQTSPSAPALKLAEGRWTVTVGEDGAVSLPSELVESFGFQPGEALLVRPEGDGLVAQSVRRSVARIQETFRKYRKPGVSVVDDLLAERRAEVAKEEEEAARETKRVVRPE